MPNGLPGGNAAAPRLCVPVAAARRERRSCLAGRTRDGGGDHDFAGPKRLPLSLSSAWDTTGSSQRALRVIAGLDPQ